MRKLFIFSFLSYVALIGVALAGRFELVQLGQARADQFLVDTQTGKIWHSACAHQSTSGCDYEIWEQMDVSGISASDFQIYKKIEKLKKADPNINHDTSNQ